MFTPRVNIGVDILHKSDYTVKKSERTVHKIKHRRTQGVDQMKVGQENTTEQTSFAVRERQLQAEQREEQQEIASQKIQDKKSPYRNFVQLNCDNLVEIRSLMKANATAALVFMFFVEHMDTTNSLVCSYKVLQEYFNLGRTTLSKSIKYLKDHGFLYVYKSGTANVYCLNPQTVWKSYGDNVRFCKFPANVLLSASEQEEIDKNRNLAYTRLKSMDGES